MDALWQQLLDLVGGDGTYAMASSATSPDPALPYALAGYGSWDEQRGQGYLIRLYPDLATAEMSLFEGDEVEPVWLMNLVSGHLLEVVSHAFAPFGNSVPD